MRKRKSTGRDLRRKALKNMLEEQERPLLILLQNNKSRIIDVLRLIRARRPRKELEKEDKLFKKFYSNEELPLLANEKIKQLIKKRRKIYSSYLELEPKKRIEVKLEYSGLMLTYLKEEAFKVNIVASTFNLLRGFSLNIEHPRELRKTANEILVNLHKILIKPPGKEKPIFIGDEKTMIFLAKELMRKEDRVAKIARELRQDEKGEQFFLQEGLKLPSNWKWRSHEVKPQECAPTLERYFRPLVSSLKEEIYVLMRGYGFTQELIANG